MSSAPVASDGGPGGGPGGGRSAHGAKGMKAPFVVRLAGPAAPSVGESIVLRLEVSKLAALAGPIRYRIALPSGVALEDGPLEGTLQGDWTEAVREVSVRIERWPSEDARVIAETGDSAAGAHAEVAYRFGRGELAAPPPGHRPPPGVRPTR